MTSMLKNSIFIADFSKDVFHVTGTNFLSIY